MDPISQARETASGTAQRSIDLASRGTTLADELRKVIGERYSTSGIAEQGAQARAGFLDQPAQTRADLSSLISQGKILSPTQQESITSAKRSSAFVPLAAANITEKSMYGTIEDLINAGVNAWKAQQAAASGAADLAQQNFQNLLNEAVQRSNIAQNEAQIAKLRAGTASEYGTGTSAEIEGLAKSLIGGRNAQGGYDIYTDRLQLVPDKLRNAALQRAYQMIDEMSQADKANLEAEALAAKRAQENSLWNRGINLIGNLFRPRSSSW